MIRIALLCPAPVPPSGASDALELADGLNGLARALAEHEIEAEIVAPIASRLSDLMDGLLRRRGFAAHLPDLPIRAARLLPGRYRLVHAFSPLDAVAAGLWARATGGVSALTWTEVPDRAHLADRRLKLRTLTAAVTACDALQAASAEVAEGLNRWLATAAPVLDCVDAAGHAQLYRQLLSARS